MAEVGCLKDGNFQNLQVEGNILPGTLVVESIITTKALTGEDSGKIFTLDLATGFTVTLPAVADAGSGWNCVIIVGTNCTSNDYIITEKASADSNIIVSQINELQTDSTTDGPSNTGHTFITLPNATDTIGDTFIIIGNGTNFFVQGTTKLTGGAALT